jgi:BirA family transcriptional regulator, biotin operon repressor / biotin---[acetyl-CoA-carboxylase] ligase
MTLLKPMLPPGYRVVCFDVIGSTNDEAKHLARGGAEEGTIVWALKQTAGRGRRGRPWISPRGNLYASLILRPDCAATRAAQLGFVAALAVGCALKTTVPELEGLSYKWPNDVLVDGRKIAGILLEAETGEGEALAHLVVGVGINLASCPPDAGFPATSLAEAGRGEVSPAAVLGELAGAFRSWLTRWRENGFEPVRSAWLARTMPQGAPIRARSGGAILHGRFLDIDEQGALVLETGGERRRIAAGEIFPAYGA